MFLKPRALGQMTLDDASLADDKKNCLKVGPCGLGKKAIYLNSFYIDRMYYIPYRDIHRVFKRVAMSKNGFGGKGVFGSMAYLVVQYGSGQEKQCNFKFEDQVDRLLEAFAAMKEELKRLNASVTVSQKEYDEVVAVKPLFLVMNYA